MTDQRLFREDIEHVPISLVALADAIDAGESWPLTSVPRRLLLLGMGSSHFAADVCARRLRAAGIDAVAELASVAATWPASKELTVVAISAGGSSAETLHAVGPHLGTSHVIALTNRVDSVLAARCDAVVLMHAGVEAGGVACRTYRNAIGCLMALESQLRDSPGVSDVIRRAAHASAELLQRASSWMPDVLECADSRDGLWLLAPAERVSSALQGALMMREGPRRRADACETGDWSHVDVYLTKPLDYRAIVFAGSRWDADAAGWLQRRGATTVSVGGCFVGSRSEVRYEGEDDARVALLTEPVVAELLAAEWWQAGVSSQ